MPEQKQFPDFRYVGSGEDDKLYELEERASNALMEVMKYREEKYNEELFGCACAEVLAVILDHFDNKGVARAVGKWFQYVLQRAEVENPEDVSEWITTLRTQAIQFGQTIQLHYGKRL